MNELTEIRKAIANLVRAYLKQVNRERLTNAITVAKAGVSQEVIDDLFKAGVQQSRIKEYFPEEYYRDLLELEPSRNIIDDFIKDCEEKEETINVFLKEIIRYDLVKAHLQPKRLDVDLAIKIAKSGLPKETMDEFVKSL